MTASRQKKLFNSTLLLTSAFAPHTNRGYADLERAMRTFIDRNGWTALDTVLATVRTRYTALASAAAAIEGDAAKLNTGATTVVRGKVLTAVPGHVDGIPDPAITYQWQRDGSNIGGATAASYTTTVSDDGTLVTCEVTYTGTGSPLVQETPGVTVTAP